MKKKGSKLFAILFVTMMAAMPVVTAFGAECERFIAKAAAEMETHTNRLAVDEQDSFYLCLTE